jgi:hypothetical protein
MWTRWQRGWEHTVLEADFDQMALSADRARQQPAPDASKIGNAAAPVIRTTPPPSSRRPNFNYFVSSMKPWAIMQAVSADVNAL